jgi:hypothetical protein
MQQASLVAACVYHATNKMVAHEETSNYHRNVHLYSLAGSKVLSSHQDKINYNCTINHSIRGTDG